MIGLGENLLTNVLILSLFGIAIVSLIAVGPVFKIVVPYGSKFSSTLAGPVDIMINSKVAWIIQEMPNIVVLGYFIFKQGIPTANFFVVLPFIIHYIHRSFVFPLMKKGGKGTPISIFFCAFFHCSINGLLHSLFFCVDHEYPISWLCHPQYILGMMIFIFGMYVNMKSDYYLISLRRVNGELQLPKEGFFKYVYQANYMGEMIEWLGYTILTNWIGALAFLCVTIGNLGPRAIQQKEWYEKKFDVKNRKALIPFIL